MNTPEKCPKCGVREVYTSDDLKSYACGTLVSASGGFFHTGTCKAFEELRKPLDAERDQLAERVRELEAWKESAMAVERQWDPNQLAAMLGGQLGESQRAVIQWKVPILVQRVKRLEEESAEYQTLFCNWKAYATNLESAGQRMLDGGYHAPHIAAEWREAKETRP